MTSTTTRGNGRKRAVRLVVAGIIGCAGLLASVTTGITPAAAAGTFTVTTTVDEVNTGGAACVSAHGCSLRAAFQAATTDGGGTVVLGTGQTYTLSAALGTINVGTNPGESYTVTGNGSTVTAQQPGTCPTTPSTCFGILSLDAPTVGNQSYTVTNLTRVGGRGELHRGRRRPGRRHRRQLLLHR